METITFGFGKERVNLCVLKRFDAPIQDSKMTIFDIHELIRDFNAKHGSNVRLIRPQVADFLFASVESTALPFEFLFPTDGAIAYELPGARLGKEIPYTTETVSYESVQVDGKYRIVDKRTAGPRTILRAGRFEGQEGVALVVLDVTCNDLKKAGNDIIIDVPESRIIAISDFPPKNACYLPHPETSVPHGEEKVCSLGTTRTLKRAAGPCVCPIVRNGCGEAEDYQRSTVFVKSGTIEGIVVEVMEKDLVLFPGERRILDVK